MPLSVSQYGTAPIGWQMPINGDFMTARPRHSDVKYSDVRPHPMGELQGFGGAVGDMHFVAGPVEQHLPRHGTVMIVIGDGNPTQSHVTLCVAV